MKKIFIISIAVCCAFSMNASGAVVINEFMADNASTIADQDGEYDDWIELYNTGDTEISLNGYYLTDDSADLTQWAFPDVSVPAHGYLAIWTDSDEEQDGLHAGFKLSASGESIFLVDPAQQVADEVTFGEQTSDISTGRYPDGTGSFVTMNPTFSAANQDEAAVVAGDIDGDIDVDIADAVAVLQLMSGAEPSATVNMKADVNGDNRIGLQEVVYIIRKISDIEVSDSVQRPEGWTEETHGDTENANYDVVFAQNKVMRINLTIDPADWQAILDDMTDIYGEFGSGNGGDDQIPQEAIDACIGMNRGDACEIVMQGQNVSGVCERVNKQLACNPNGAIPGEEASGGGAPGGEIPPDGGENPGGMGTSRNPIWKPCTFKFKGITWYNVGVRFKGNSSLSSSWKGGIWKIPLRFDFDEFEDDYPEIDDQRFYGFKKLSMSSGFKDSTLIREKVTADIFREAGVPAAQTAFYRVYIDHGEGPLYFGLYTMVEIPDEPMFSQQFSETDGNLYKPEGTSATFAGYDEELFDKETNEDEADYSDVLALYDALHSSRNDSVTWRASLDAALDTDDFMHWLAVNTLVQNWDTYGLMSHNYYIYTDPGDSLIHWIPWDNNMALNDSVGMKAPLSLYLTSQEVNDSWPLIRYLVDDSVYWAKYVAYVRQTSEGAFEPEKMKVKYQNAHDLIRAYVVGDEGETEGYTHLTNSEDFDTGLEYLFTHVESRRSAALEFLQNN
ncbi:MAG: hypothetical protein GY795_16970 [Desulfobacterales bacterium]|nr:hypothetical protein [Desulfobacterales bacterium]